MTESGTWFIESLMSDARQVAWDSLWEAVPARWTVGPASYDPGVLRSDGHLGAVERWVCGGGYLLRIARG
jgi:hypothetical protein